MQNQTETTTETTTETKPQGQSNLAKTIRSHRKSYKAATKPDGKKTQNNGDAVATALLGVSLAALKEFSAMKFSGKRYDHLNDGHARMCIGNNIRAEVNRGNADILLALLAV